MQTLVAYFDSRASFINLRRLDKPVFEQRHYTSRVKVSITFKSPRKLHHRHCKFDPTDWIQRRESPLWSA